MAGYILPIKPKTQRELEELIRKRRELERQAYAWAAQDEVNLMAAGSAAWTEEQRQRQLDAEQLERDQWFADPLAKSQRDQSVSTFGDDLAATPYGGDELENLRTARAEQRQELKERRGAAEASAIPGLPVPTAQPIVPTTASPKSQAAREAKIRGEEQVSPTGKAGAWAARERGLIDKLVDDPEYVGPSEYGPGGLPIARTGAAVRKEDVVPIPKPQAADPSNVATTGITITPEFARAIRQDDSLAQEIVDQWGEDVIIYEGKPANWVPGDLGMKRLLQTGLGVADVGIAAPADFVIENALQAGKYVTSNEGGDFMGYTEAIDAFRERDMIQQVLFGVVFDPLAVVGALGLLGRTTRAVGTGFAPINRTQLRAAVKNAAPDITDAEVNRATDRIMEEYAKAGGRGPTGFSAQPEGGWESLTQQPKAADLLKMGGYRATSGTQGKSDIDYGNRLTRFAARVEAVSDPESEIGERLWEAGRPLDVIENYNVQDKVVFKAGVEDRMAREGYEPEWTDIDLPKTAAGIREEAELNIGIGRRKGEAAEQADIDERMRAMEAGQAKWEEQQTSKAIRAADVKKIERYMERLTRDIGGGEFNEASKMAIIRQLTNSDNPAVQEQVFTRYLRTIQKILSDAAKAERDAVGEGRVDAPLGVGQRAPLEAGGGRVPDAPRPQYQLVETPGELTAPPETRVPQRTVSAGPGDPNVGEGRLMPRGPVIEGTTPREKVDATYKLVFRQPQEVEKTVGERVRETWEEVQAITLDKYAKANASSTRAEREFIKAINEFLDADIARINAERIQDATSGGLSANSPQVKALMVRRGDPGFEPVDRIPAEFNLQVQIALSSGMPNAGKHVSEKVLREALEALGGNRLRVDPRDLDQYLTLRHSIDIVKLINKHDPLKKPAGWKGRAKDAAELARRAPPTERGTRTGPAGMTMNEMQGALWNIRETYKGTGAYQNLLNAAGIIRQHYSDMLDFQVREGMVSRETADTLHAQFPYYNPIEYTEGVVQHIVDADKAGRAHLLGVPENDLRELAKQGISASVRRPLAILAPQTMAVYSSVGRNRVIRSLIHSLIYDPVWNQRVVKMSDERGRLKTKQARTALAGEKVGTPYQVNVARMVNGKAEVWSIPREMAEIVTQLGQFDQSFLESTLRTMNRPQRLLYTAANPIFFVLNFLHDTVASFMKEGVMPWDTGWELMAGVRKIVQGDRWVDELGDLMKTEGGYVGGLISGLYRNQDDILEAMGSPISRMVRQRSLNQNWMGTGFGEGASTQAQGILAQMDDPRLTGPLTNRKIERMHKGVAGKAWSDLKALVSSPGWLIANTANAVEQAPRRATMRKVMNQGYSAQEAAYRARAVTIDFKRRGKAIGIYDAAILYGNAAIQGAMLPVRAVDPGSLLFNPLKKGKYGSEGWDKFGSGMKRYGPGRLRLAGVAGVGLGIYAWNATQFPESNKNMSLKDKLTTWSIQYAEEYDDRGNLVPKSISVLPILRELAATSAPLIYLMERLREESPADWKQYLTTLLPVINPLSTITNVGGRDANFSWQGLPSAAGIAPLQHVMDIFNNWDSFRNREIIPADMRQLPVTEQYNQYTSEAAKRISKYIGVSPMYIDQFWNLGIFREAPILADNIIQLYEDKDFDPELDGVAAEVAIYTESLLSDLEGADLKRRNTIIDDQLHGSGHNFSADEIRKIKLYINREDTAIPVGTTMMNRLHRKSGGQIRSLGELRANREWGIDSQQSVLASDEVRLLRDTNRDAQIKIDGRLWMNHTEPRLDGSTMSGKQWIAARQVAGDSVRMNMIHMAERWPNAAILKHINETGGNVADWANFKKVIYTGAGEWEDTRLQSQIYASAYRGIAMTYIGEGDDTPDYTTYFDQREELRNHVLEEAGGADTELYRQFEQELSRYLTDTERKFQDDMDVLRPYWEMPHLLKVDDPHKHNPNLPPNFIPLPRGRARDTWARYLASNNDQRTTMTRGPDGTFISGVLSRLGGYRDTYRGTNPEMDRVYIRWGYATEPATQAGFEELQRLMEMSGEPIIPPYEGQSPENVQVGVPQPLETTPYQVDPSIEERYINRLPR